MRLSPQKSCLNYSKKYFETSCFAVFFIPPGIDLIKNLGVILCFAQFSAL